MIQEQISLMADSHDSPASDLNRRDGRFKARYWSDLALDLCVQGPDGAQQVRLDQPFARIGSHPRSDLVLKGRDIARRHLYLHATPQGVYCIDFEYRKAFGHRVDYWVSRKHGVQIGPYRLLATPRPAPAEETRRDRFWNTRPPAAWKQTPVLTFVHRGKLMGRYPIRRRLISIGRHPLNNVRCKAPSVSDFHAVMYWEADQLWVIDLFASGKTQLFNAEIDVSDFHRQTKLRLGRVAVAHSWTDDWKAVIEQYKTLWEPKPKRAKLAAGDEPSPGSEPAAASEAVSTEVALSITNAAVPIPPPLVSTHASMLLAETSPVEYALTSPTEASIAPPTPQTAENAAAAEELQTLHEQIEIESARLHELQLSQASLQAEFAVWQATGAAEREEAAQQLQQLRIAIVDEQAAWARQRETEIELLAQERAALDNRVAQVAAAESGAHAQQLAWDHELGRRQRALDERERAIREAAEAAAQRESELELLRANWESSQASADASARAATHAAQTATEHTKELAAELAQLRAERLHLANALQASEAQRQQLAADLQAAREVQQAGVAAIQSLRAEWESLQQASQTTERELRAQLQAQTAELERRTAAIEQLRSEISDTRADHARRERAAADEAQELRNTLALVQTALVSAESVAASRATATEQAEQQVVAWRRQFDDLTVERQADLQRTAQLRDEIEQLRAELADGQQRLSTFESDAAAEHATAQATLVALRQAHQELARQLAVIQAEGELQIEQWKRTAANWQAEAAARAEELSTMRDSFAATAQASTDSLRLLQEELEQLRQRETKSAATDRAERLVANSRPLDLADVPCPAQREMDSATADHETVETRDMGEPSLPPVSDLPLVVIPDLGDGALESSDSAASGSEIELVQEALFDHLRRLRTEQARWRRMLRRFGIGRK